MIYLAADIHGYIRLDWLKAEINKLVLDANDYLIILGDAGIVWSETEYLEVKEYYNSLPCLTLFVDGNHENFSMLNNCPIETRFGGKIHSVSDKIIHLMRGEVYTIDGKSFFVFGGGFSLKRLTNTSPVTVWNEEMPNNEEYQNGIKNLEKYHNMVDYVLSHVAPYSIARNNGIIVNNEERELNDYLESINQNIRYSHWFFGHYHKDFDYGKFNCLFEKVLPIGE